MKSIILPQEISDGRLDTLLQVMAEIKMDDGCLLDWSHVTQVLPAGYAILACLFDSVLEQKEKIKNIYIKKKFRDIAVIQNLNHLNQFRDFPKPQVHNFEDKYTLLEGHAQAVCPDFLDRVEYKFSHALSEDLMFSCRLIFNELMVNSVDHSTAERYYLYAGLDKEKNSREFHFGVLDMGVTIPAKLERKYTVEDDLVLLEMALQEGISTRRQRHGGLGLYYTLEHVKINKGRLTLLSRNAQIRRYFNRKSSIKSLLKHTLDGTWCFVRFFLGRKSA